MGGAEGYCWGMVAGGGGSGRGREKERVVFKCYFFIILLEFSVLNT